ncbi:MAG: hypothetical protein ACRD0K_15430 [Egibacteraceae bacterium]
MSDTATAGVLLVAANACVLAIVWIQAVQIAGLRRQAGDLTRAVTDLFLELPGHGAPASPGGQDPPGDGCDAALTGDRRGRGGNRTRA